MPPECPHPLDGACTMVTAAELVPHAEILSVKKYVLKRSFHQPSPPSPGSDQEHREGADLPHL